MKKIEIKHKFTNEVLFSHECENNTIKITLELAVKSSSNLSYSDLRGSDLRGSDLSGSNLSNSNLSNSNLSYSDLRGSDLSNSDLRRSNLRGSDLSGSNLSNSNLSNSEKVPIFCKWSHGITNGNLIHVGCKKRTIEEWDKFFSSDEKLITERNTPEFKQIEAVYLAYKAYLTHLNS